MTLRRRAKRTAVLVAEWLGWLDVVDSYWVKRLLASEHHLERPLRRALNVFVALAAIVFMLPLWILIAVAIKLSSRGPVLYKVERIGGRPFMAYKFRTMRVDAENSTGAIWSAKHDPRVMAIGRFLRHYGFDELPQLINVLKGDMNIVGPRAERPTIFAELREKIPNYEIRQGVRPGITGYAQVHLKYESSIEDVAERLKYDLEYVRHQSVLADLHIMAKAVQMIFHERSGSAVSRDVADEAAAMRQLYERERAF